ncbi:MAG: hypothetical protein J0H14_03830 [Alphaproteobacteria bacterium]|nr:hypothetical protein [Alphaproteobacteria bacterium]
MDKLIGLAGEKWPILGLIGACALAAFSIAFFHFSADLKEPGNDRDRLRLAQALGGLPRTL